MIKPKVYIRTDGGTQIGLGHLVRCSALAYMLQDDFAVTFFCREIPDRMVMELAENGLGYIIIADEDEFHTKITSSNIVVLDGYHFDTAYQKQIKTTGAKLVCIDDLIDKEFYADLIINHAPGVKSEDYRAQLYTQFALGPQYALLRPAFLEQAKKKRKIEKIETTLICFGGSDYKNLTESTLREAIGFNKLKNIIVVIGSAYKYMNSLKPLLLNDQRIQIHHALDEKQMLALMLEADLAIVPASGILLEVLAVGCRVISGMYTDNQKFIYSNYKKSCSFIDAFNFNADHLNKAIEKTLNSGSKEKKIFDGTSGKRLLKRFLQLGLKDKVKLRIANEFDVKVTYRWATEPVIRVYSFNQNIITKEEHTSWFQTKLKDSNCLYLIAEMDDYEFGSIRFDIKGKEAIINYLIDPRYHGKGLGQIILSIGIEYLVNVTRTKNLNFQKVVGYVMKTNIPSIKAFERSGFNKYNEQDKYKFERLI